jgi:tripartite ATP-independent transporter DctP family solute receptor
MVKRIFKVIVISSIALGFIFGIYSTSNARVTAKMSIYGPLGPYEVMGGAALVFKNIVESKTGGEVEVQIYPNRQLGGDMDTVRGADTGMIEIVMCSDGGLASFAPEVQAIGLPYLFPSEDIAWRVLDGPMGDKIKAAVEKRINVYVLGIAQNGFRCFTNNVRVIKKPADLKGLKIRTMQIKAHMEIVKALGAIPVPMSGEEEYTALQQGVIDGEENAPWWVDTAKFYEVVKNMTMDKHVYGVHFYIASKKFVDSLTPYQRSVIFEAGRRAAVTQNGINEARNAIAIEKLKKEGMKLYFPTEQEIAEFRQVTVQPVSAFVKGAIGGTWVDQMYEAVKKAQKELRH